MCMTAQLSAGEYDTFTAALLPRRIIVHPWRLACMNGCPSAKIRQGKSLDAIPTECIAQYRKYGGILSNGQFLPLAKEPALWRKVTGEYRYRADSWICEHDKKFKIMTIVVGQFRLGKIPLIQII